MEAFVEAFVETPVEFTSTEAFKKSISPMEASTKASMKTSGKVNCMKAVITSTKASIPLMKLLWKLLRRLGFREAVYHTYESSNGGFHGSDFHGSFRGNFR